MTTLKKSLAVLVVGLLLLAALLSYRWSDRDIQTDAMFEKIEFKLPLYDLFDVGIADVDGNGFLDIYTANHSARQAVFVAQENMQYVDMIDVLGLSQDRLFYDLEDSVSAPAFDTPGYYIYRKNRLLHIKAHKTESIPKLQVSIVVPWPAYIDSATNASSEVETQLINGKASSKITFSLSPGESVVLNGVENIVELPHQFEFNDESVLKYVFIGQQKLSPVTTAIKLWWRDRHAMLWSDVNGDEQIDVYIGRGGVKGQLDQVGVVITDELMLSSNSVFTDHLSQFAIDKYHCPARQGSWIDYDADGDLDLYLVCGRGEVLQYPNLMFQRTNVNEFIEVGEQIGLDYKGRSKFAWLDVDNDGDMDHLSIQGNEIVYYKNNNAIFEPEIIESNLPNGYVRITVVDIDSDGFSDAFAVSRTQSRVLKNIEGQLVSKLPTEFGLPRGTREANWVDYDNDGLTDIHLVPGGLYKQDQANQFHKTELLNESESINDISSTICNWFDMDNDGFRDVLCALERHPPKELRVLKKLRNRTINTRYWTEYFFRNLHIENSNNWLEIDVKGDKANTLSLGARVEVTTGGMTQYATVGQSEGAHYSQGHYRLYFGLGEAEVVDTIKVTWTDGYSKLFNGSESGQIVVLRKLQN